ncbi:MAG: carbohydrate binding domain-containing protein, partial [Verrucomicrobiales bacterium]|nr:carbohydrate binding domain-containing protein [Verrucomicrobiales bacterium]
MKTRCLCCLWLASCVSGWAVPFVLPWDDALPGVVTDFSAMNSPIGPESVVTVDTNGQFVVNGRRIQFLGVNFAGDSPFMPTNKADAVAARLAKFGINCVRFHHLDAPWAYGGGILSYTSTRSTNFNASQLEKLHYVVARLKAHGIYANINLLVGRQYRSQDGLGPAVTTMDWKDQHILGFFNDIALALHKDYATKLLTPTNRFTGLPLAKDPAVAFVEIINENGLIQKWLDGGLDRLPTNYAAQLQTRWNDWLRARYTNDAALAAAWKIFDVPLGPNLLANGAFSNGLTGWVAEQHDTARAGFTRTFEYSNSAPCARIVVTNLGSAGWHIQLNYPGLRVTNAQPYTLAFSAKSSPATNFEASVMQAHPDWRDVGLSREFSLTTNWQRFSNAFEATMSDPNVRVNFGGMGLSLATFWVADVSLQPGGRIGTLPGGATLAQRTVPNIRYAGEGYTGTIEARKDWLRFLRDLEHRYYDLMVAHLRTNCGYSGIIFGTVMMNSPATVQSRLDVIDGHAYWQHPQFPGTPWDPVNWYVPNVSMVNTLGEDNALADLARQRIRGKPFTVTEYNHPQPMYYGAEAPLLLAAYAAFQDWDGVWLFDYGHGQDATATMGCVRGFFDTAQHAGKMANLLLAANLFRRGDVRPATHEITLALTPDQEIDLLLNTWAWGVFSSRQLGVSGRLAFTNRLSVSIGTHAVGLTNPPAPPAGNVVTSDTGELQWNLSRSGRGVVTINTPRTKALVGYVTNR